MKKITLLLVLIFPAICFSQKFIGKSKEQVKKQLQQQITKNDGSGITITDNDSGIFYSVKHDIDLTTEFYYTFDKAGKCQLEKVVAGCDSCFTKYLQATLAEKKYGWKKINENQYISNYTSRMMIELPAESKELTYTILRTEWTKQLYAMLTGN